MSFLLNRLSIRNRIWTIIAILIGSIVLGGVMDVLMLRQELWHEKEHTTRQLVESSFSVLVHFHDLQRQGVLSEAAAQAAAIATIKAMRYDEREYFWLQDLGTPFPRMIMHPTVPALDGKVLDAEQFNHATHVRVGKDGAFAALDGRKNLFVVFVEVVNQVGQGYVTYYWPKPKAGGGVTGELYPKLSYVKKFAAWGWLIGSGIYIDDVDKAVREQAGRTVALVAGGGFVLLLLASLIGRSITQPLCLTAAAMRAIAKGERGLGQRLPVDGHSEIAGLAESFNDMLGHLEARDAELARHRNQLEQQVAERTREISQAKSLLEADIEQRKRFEAELESLRYQYELILNSAGAGIYGVDEAFNTSFVNPAACNMLGWEAQELLGRNIHGLVHHTRADGRPYPVEECPIASAVRAGAAQRVEDEVFWRKDGTSFEVEYTIRPILDRGRISGAVVMFADISERKQAERQLQMSYSSLKELNAKLVKAQNQLLQSEKMACIGQLAAGVAHEINNPIGYVSSNIGTLEQYLDDYSTILDAYEKAEPGLDECSAKAIGELKARKDLAFLKQDVRDLLAESREGINRVKKIVRDLKEFSHVDEKESWKLEDLQQGLESTLNVVWNELKYKCAVEKEYGELPLVECLLPQLNQVFMNLLVNAAQAIDGKGIITLRSGTEGERVWVEVADTGKGIPPENLPRLFEPFFTTKPVGKGTGLGLSVSYSIVQKHHGEIAVASTVGAGSAFRVWLPLRQPAESPAA